MEELELGLELEEEILTSTDLLVQSFTSSFGSFVVAFSFVFLVGYFAHLVINFIKGV